MESDDDGYHFPAITRALNILRERYKDQITNKSEDNQFEANDVDDVEDDSLQTSQDPCIDSGHGNLRSNIFVGLADRAKYLKLKQKRGTIISQTNAQVLRRNEALARAIQLCERLYSLWSLMNRWKLYLEKHRALKNKFRERYEKQKSQELRIFSQKFSPQHRQICIQRFGKVKLSDQYDNWRICKFFFNCWLKSIYLS